MRVAVFGDCPPTLQATDDKWHAATLAEANLHLDEEAAAIRAYTGATGGLDARERSSMYQQAIWTARLLNKDAVETSFGGVPFWWTGEH